MPVAANPLTNVEVRPRPVATSVVLSAYFGGKVVQIAWGMMLIAIGVIWACVTHESFHPLGMFALLGPTQQVHGVVSDLNILSETDMGDGGVKEAFGVKGEHLIRQTINRITYKYSSPDGRTFSGVARVGRDDGEFCEIGAPVTVTYAAYNPGASRVEGLRLNWAGTGSFVMIGFWIFTAGALWMMYPLGHGLSRGMRASTLLRNGKITSGRLRAAECRSIMGLYQVTDVAHSFSADGQNVVAVRVRVDDLKKPLPESEPVFFDESDPAAAVTLSDIPGGADLDESGVITEGKTNGYNTLCLPMICLAVSTWFMLDLLNIAPGPSLSMFQSLLV